MLLVFWLASSPGYVFTYLFFTNVLSPPVAVVFSDGNGVPMVLLGFFLQWGFYDCIVIVVFIAYCIVFFPFARMVTFVGGTV